MEGPKLAHQLVTREGATPSRWMLVLHGILGMGTNFRSIAKLVNEREPSWGFILPDLRGHGASQGFAPPHTVAAAARDLDDLAQDRGLDVRGVAGHSFGGKVALAYLERRKLAVACILDANPGLRAPGHALDQDSAAGVLATLEGLPKSFASRDAFQSALRETGYSRAIVDWLSMNLRRVGAEYQLRLDLPAIRSMLEDYFDRDLWQVIESPGRADSMLLMIAGRSPVFDEHSRARAAAAAASNPGLRVVELPEASHWLHVDDPSAVALAITAAMRTPAALSGVLG